jgi:hypothetical protein
MATIELANAVRSHKITHNVAVVWGRTFGAFNAPAGFLLSIESRVL